MRYQIVLFSLMWSLIVATNLTKDDSSRASKALSVFQVVRFPNSVCAAGGSYNGTCFTSSECLSKGGTNSGSCASGFGVCCTFVLSCGGTASANCTYLVQSSVTTLTSPCTYTICPCNTNICRIRFDFTSFVIADPANTPALAAGVTTAGGSLGDCVTDTFSITSPASQGSPIICGFNTGQHMIVDANSCLCHKASFFVGSSTATSRFWNIKVTQYACGSEFLGGPPQCLQYFSGTTGTISSYNFPTTSAAVPANAQHLNNQCYEICIRRESGFCYICYTPTISISIAPIQNSFGLSIATIATMSAINTECTTDYLVIPGGLAIGSVTPVTTSLIVPTTFRVCGNFFNPATGTAINLSVCSRMTPFRLYFKTNADEVSTGTAATANEMAGFPSGTIGFSLKYVQGSC